MVNFMIPLRAAQATLTVVVLGLTAYVSNWWANYWRDMSPIEINFLLFCSVFSLATSIYLSLAALNKLPAAANHRFALLAADAMTMTFWFAGFIALAVFLSSRVCFGNVCNVAKASVAFGAFNWLLFAISTAWAGMYTFRRRGAAPKGMEPSMSQGA
ncbi:hypothetical protein BLS_004106 [Venturia inaequalis]|uniref:MARVEL domain-containing protein n=1 Tax=Venturia inaequalis TaxID=5025 RepID=A0A8H3YSX8_VENIN|nr:hypothetical protein EG328_005962 [Venturia inaequalis]KAE9972234.1 hypothetical protein BLS_004106 [Venturia inaequalis]KAE9984566.1 hypothetical protein EG327_004979 [Venturia inaequalis]RDI87631.1 hypothetical protein Vi05172_g2486 [Venturia inaequalis]